MRSTVLLSHSLPPGESPPPALRDCFGRDELIEKIIGLAETLTPIALLGVGGIGKTSIALAVLHHDNIKKQFGDDRRFIRCDQFPASCTNFLAQLSKVIGAGVENPEDLTPLRPFLSSRKMLLFLDNAESILDPRGVNGKEFYAVVKEMSQISNICLCITSRITTVPPACKIINIPTLSKDAAHDTFNHIYEGGGQSDLINSILEQLDFHPLSITLLATIAHYNKWDTNRLAREWGRQQTDVLHTQHNESFAAAIELSLASPLFQELGPNSRDLLGVIAFFPQGVDENNLDWLFPTLSNTANIFDNFCILSLTYRSNGFITMLAPLRAYLCPKDPTLSPLLQTAKDCYFRRLSVDVVPGWPGFEEAEWIRSEDVNVEHMLDVFTSCDMNSVAVWEVCGYFMEHLFWHKKRLVVLGPKIKELPDNHASKPDCLLKLSQLFDSVGGRMESKQLLVHALELWRERGNDLQVAHTLRVLSDTNRLLGLCEEGIQQVEEASGIYERLNSISGQAHSLQELGQLLLENDQLDAAEKAISKAVILPLDVGQEFLSCRCYRILGNICHSKGETEKAINHFKTAIRIASSPNWHSQLFWSHYGLAELFSKQGRFDDAHAQVRLAKLHIVDDTYLLGRTMHLQARIWRDQRRLKEAKTEALRAAEVYERLGATTDLEVCKETLLIIEGAINEQAVSHR